MDKNYSVAEAKNRLPELIRQAEGGDSVQITRRGRPVAVILSQARFAQLQSRAKPDLWGAIQKFRAAADFEGIELTNEEIDSWRDKSPGRDFSWSR